MPLRFASLAAYALRRACGQLIQKCDALMISMVLQASGSLAELTPNDQRRR